MHTYHRIITEKFNDTEKEEGNEQIIRSGLWGFYASKFSIY